MYALQKFLYFCKIIIYNNFEFTALILSPLKSGKFHSSISCKSSRFLAWTIRTYLSERVYRNQKVKSK